MTIERIICILIRMDMHFIENAIVSIEMSNLSGSVTRREQNNKYVICEHSLNDLIEY